MHTSSLEVEHLKRLILQKMEYTYLDQYIQPIIDEYKLKILMSIVQYSNLPQQTKEKYIVTTMLVQIALDTHELVPIDSNNDESNHMVTTRQLTVLAGDYYSGLYYLILSEIQDIEFIQMLARAIKEMNELKIKRYYKEVNSIEEFLKLEQQIESLLISKVAEFVNLSSVNHVSGHLLIINKLIAEKVSFHANKQTPFLEKWNENSTLETYPPILKKLDLTIEKNIKMFTEKMNLIPQGLKNSFQQILNDLKVQFEK